MEAESVPTFASPSSTSFPFFNLQEKYNRLTNTHIFFLQMYKVKFKVASTNIFVGCHHFEKGLSVSINSVIRDGGVLPTHYNFTWGGGLI